MSERACISRGHCRVWGDILEIFLKYAEVRLGECACGDGLLQGPLRLQSILCYAVIICMFLL